MNFKLFYFPLPLLFNLDGNDQFKIQKRIFGLVSQKCFVLCFNQAIKNHLKIEI